ncbi:MAG: nicotinate phosphoribosyltransferase, partial [Acidobacteriota bacterium]|nr:nicotinate phosphoribosyltransferase [Acidobacteriota bacterium]
MPSLADLYRPSLALVSDLYQLTMAYGYWRQGLRDAEGVFHLSFRANPCDGGFTVALGQSAVESYVSDFRFSGDDLDYLADLRRGDGEALFGADFLGFLGDLVLDCDVDAVVEGTVVFPGEPVLRVRGSLIQGQMLETALLNLMNFQSLIATKAARVCLAADGDDVVEFGLRRAQGFDGGVSASRAAFIGGCAATSNLLAGRLHGIPVRGTHAHSWVLAFDDELSAFRAYAEVQPADTVLLLDTFDTRGGVELAIEVGHWLRGIGYDLVGVRLDSGDLIGLSRHVRKRLDEAGLERVGIVASGDLDETEILK